MSTRSSIWLGESDGKCVHIYWELAERELENGKMVRAPICIAVDEGDAKKEVVVRLPKAISEELLKVLKPDYRGYCGHDVA